MHYSTNAAWEGVAAPAIAETRAWVAGRHFPLDKPLIDVAQAVPGYPPPRALTEHLARLIGEAGSHRYTEIEGLPALRQELASHMSGFYGASIGADNVAITAGCNQAYCLVVNRRPGMTPNRQGVNSCSAMFSLTCTRAQGVNLTPIGGHLPMPIHTRKRDQYLGVNRRPGMTPKKSDPTDQPSSPSSK
jgi:histidinol-phosphate/aromatic aminotransferase/cobyric acid decarboxylase-like protein